MELFIGGSFQGKTRYAKEKFPDYVIYDEVNFKGLSELAPGKKVILNHFHLCVKALLEERTQEEIALWMEELLERFPDMLLISDEVGSGIVPMEKAERQFREVTGRLLCDVAKRAERVVRFVCGIPTQIK